MRIVLATHNAHKLVEVRALFAGSSITVVGLDAFGDVGEVPEDHETFAANALQKARFVYKRFGLATVADDSGIEIRALDWAPGVRSKRWTPQGTDAANNTKLLHVLDGQNDRMAQYKCAIGLVTELGERSAEGVCTGTIGTTHQGAGGFGYDPLFWPTDTPGRTMAEISLAEKNRISHRAQAFAQLPGLVASLYSSTNRSP
jgi:XTP/dITP diphosphohydrolase